MKTLASRQAYEAAIKEGTVVVVFSAQWCADCRVIEPVLPEIEEKYSQLKFFQVDRDQLIDLCQELDIFGIPSFIIYRDGTEIDRFVSKDRKTQAEIESFIDKAIS
ncbi:MAG: thioredoxin family protein [Firmicutes bacterium]|nr:thioredoxin family protein [Bacillota bacterium]